MTPPGAALSAALAGFLAGGPRALGVAVSGGGDSMALLHLLAGWARERGATLAAVTVDHGLRPEAAAEAAMVARVCAALGVPHETLHWRGWDGRGNLSDAARRARYDLIAAWARRHALPAVAIAHTQDDQAETVLLRLARGSGVDGLSGMRPRRESRGVQWLRPLLTRRRSELRSYLTDIGVGWAEDPSNANPAYDRVKARRALEALAALGIDAPGLARTADRMAMARAALEQAAQALARTAARVEAGDVVFDIPALTGAPQELRLRLVAHALRWVASADYRPRLAALTGALDQVLAGQRRTLGGCILAANRRGLRIAREYGAVRALRCPVGQVWDGRWSLSGPDSNGLEVGALGADGLARCPDWRGSGLPHASAIATPAVWRGETLVAAPLAGLPNGWQATLVRGGGDFASSILSH